MGNSGCDLHRNKKLVLKEKIHIEQQLNEAFCKDGLNGFDDA